MQLKLLGTMLFSLVMIGCGGGGDTAESPNQVPIANAGSDRTAQVNEIISIIGTGIDSDGTIVSYQWYEGTIFKSDAAIFDYSSTVEGTHRLTLTVTDNDGATDRDSMIVNVAELVNNDIDNDYIPNDIEMLLGLNVNNADENNNNVLDGLETTGTFGDEFFKYQWHIRSLGTFTNDSNVPTIVGNDLNLLDIYHTYMGYNGGNHMIVQVVDTGVDADHPDLINNMDLSRSLDGEIIGDPSGTDAHGTMVAGIMSAQAFNTIGVRGIIPFAKIAGSNWLESQTYTGLELAWVTGTGANEIAVSNNSWGSYFDTDTDYEDWMEIGTRDLRDGKGRMYVFAAGNDRDSNGNANLSYSLSNRYQISVAALQHTNIFASYSTPGSNILVSGYSGNTYQDSPTISTTHIVGQSSNAGNLDNKTTWTEDTSENYTYIMNGTSAASPTVAASIALVLEACPNLTWRDVKYLTAKHAKQIDMTNSSWVTNSVGLKHSIDYGYGLINAIGMIGECNSTYSNLTVELSATASDTFNTVILDNNTKQSFSVNMPNNMTVEWVEVTIDNNSTYASDYTVELTSPSGTKTTLMTGAVRNDISPFSWMNGGFRMSTAAMIDEQSIGSWSVDITDILADDSGTLKTIELKIYGH